VLVGLGAALLAAALFGSGSIVQAIAVRRLPEASGLSPRLVGELLTEPMFLLAMALNLAGFSMHLVALRSIPLFLAQSGIAASLAVTALLAVRIVGDDLGPADWVAVAAVCVGLALMAASSGAVGDETAGGTFVAGIYAGLVVLALVGLLASWARGPTWTAVLGLLAGFGFAGVGISARILPSLTPAALVGEPATYALLVSGALAFLLYSVALQRESVTAATAPLIVSQTVTPALIGVLLLNDQIRTGWIPIALLGFVVTGAGAIRLGRFERTSTTSAQPA
jgi:drug/metabolite transporter (DMT)-like permease